MFPGFGRTEQKGLWCHSLKQKTPKEDQVWEEDHELGFGHVECEVP